MQDTHGIGAIVHGQLRPMLDGLVDMAVVGLIVLTLDGKDWHAVLDHQRRGCFILRAQGVAGTQPRIRSTSLERAHKVGRLGSHVQTGGNPNAFQRLFPLKAFTNKA